MSRPTIVILILVLIIGMLCWTQAVREAASESRIHYLTQQLSERERFVNEQNSPLISDPENIHIDNETLIDTDDLNLTLFTVVSPRPHTLEVKVDGRKHTIESAERFYGNATRLTVVIDRYDEKVKATLSCDQYQHSMIEKVENRPILKSMVFPELSGSRGLQTGYPHEPVLLFRWSGKTTVTVRAIFNPT